MKTKPYLYSQPDYLIFRAAIGGILVQRSDSLSFEASEVLVLIYFCILCSTKSYKETSGFLRAEPLSSYFEDRKGYREGKVQPAQLQGEFLSAKSVFPPLIDFNNFFTIHIPTQDQNNPQGLRVHKHIFVGNSRSSDSISTFSSSVCCCAIITEKHKK